MSERLLRVGVIGTGRKKDRPDTQGFFIAYRHAEGYEALPTLCKLVACADIVRENAEAFAAVTGIPEQGIYTDYHAMLAEADLDIVSICTWPHLHARMTIDCARAGVRAVHCEKPMADNWGDARLMVQECARRDVQLTFNHQRRFGAPFVQARDLLKGGAIGALRRIEIGTAKDIYDTGTHWIDLCGMYVDEVPAEWVIGQVDYRAEQRIFGAHGENQALAAWRYSGGIHAMLSMGHGAEMIGATIRLLGAEGTIEIGVTNGPDLRLRRGTGAWEVVDTGGEGLHGSVFHQRAVADTVEALVSGREPQLSAWRAFNATEIIFAIYESSRRRGRVDLPLTVGDHPLVAMVDAGHLLPEPSKV